MTRRRYTGFSTEVKDLVYTRAGGACERCGERTSDEQFHHRSARRSGGTRRPEINAVSNALLLCAECHRHVESYRTLSYERGWLVRSCGEPLAIPVLRHDGWALLDDDGNYYRIPEPENGVAS